MQSKAHSFIESCTNTAVGYGVAFLTQALVFPLFGIHVSMATNAKIGLVFTAVSIARGYLLRRWFTRKTEPAR